MNVEWSGGAKLKKNNNNLPQKKRKTVKLSKKDTLFIPFLPSRFAKLNLMLNVSAPAADDTRRRLVSARNNFMAIKY